jgi:RND family efflux transporter MFP subunit
MSDKQGVWGNWKRNGVLLAALLIGGAVILLASNLKRPPKPVAVAEQAVKVRAMKVAKLDVVPRTTGFGRVAPAKSWEAVAEVAGQVVWLADGLQHGRIVKAGSELLRIEDADYRLQLEQSEAQLQASEIKRKSAMESLATAEKNLALLQKDYKRQQQLAAKGTISKATLEATERQLLAGKSQVESQTSALELIRAEHQALLAQRDSARLNLERTTITAPFDVRITRVNIGSDQYANKGQLLFTADGLERAEVEAQFAVGVLRPLIRALNGSSESPLRAGVTGLNALVRLRTADHQVEWPARVDRVAGTIEPQTQSLGVVVTVERPYASAIPGERPPLLRDTFVEVELFSPPLAGQLVIPRSALHEGKVYLINSESRLEIRPVTVDFALEGYAVIKAGLSDGERIVTSELLSATAGMLLEPQEDRNNKRQMIIEATGQDPKS